VQDAGVSGITKGVHVGPAAADVVVGALVVDIDLGSYQQGFFYGSCGRIYVCRLTVVGLGTGDSASGSLLRTASGQFLQGRVRDEGLCD
jgi:hypothetical protein